MPTGKDPARAKEGGAFEIPPEEVRAAGARGSNGAEGQWPDLIPLAADLSLPAFPLDVLPEPFRGFCVRVSIATQTPVDLSGMLVLTVLSTACARKFEVEARLGWVQPVNVYVVIVLPSGNRKSHVFSAAVSPLKKFEQDEAIRLAPTIRSIVIRRKVLEEQLDNSRKTAAKAKGEPNLTDVQRLAEQIEAIPNAVAPRLLADDVTPEKLVGMLAQHGGRLGVMSPEGGFLNILAGRYSNDGMPNLELLKKAYTGEDHDVDRVIRGSERLKKPALTLALTVQPGVFRRLIQNDIFRGEGFLSRPFYCLPISTVGSREVRVPPVPKEIAESYAKAVRDVLSIAWKAESPDGGHEPHDLTFDDEGREALLVFEEKLEPRLGEGGDLAGIADWALKLAGGIARVAALLHVARHAGRPVPSSIDGDTVKDAIRVGDYLLAHALAAFAEAGLDRVGAAAKCVLKWIRRKRQAIFSQHDAYQDLRSSIDDPETMASALDRLEQHAYLRKLPPPEKSASGRPPGPTFCVNPKLLETHPQNPRNPGDGCDSRGFEHFKDASQAPSVAPEADTPSQGAPPEKRDVVRPTGGERDAHVPPSPVGTVQGPSPAATPSNGPIDPQPEDTLPPRTSPPRIRRVRV